MTTTTHDGGKARFSQVGVFKCPSGVPMDAFVEKCGEVMAAILATPVGDKLVGLKIMSPDAANNARLEQLGWTVDKTTVTTVSEFASAEDFFVYASNPEVKQIFQKAQEAFGNDTRLFVADVVRKQDDVAPAAQGRGKGRGSSTAVRPADTPSLEHAPTALLIELHLNAAHAAAQRGWDAVTWSVASRDARTSSHGARRGIECSRVLKDFKGWTLVAEDPDGTMVPWYCKETHEWDQGYRVL